MIQRLAMNASYIRTSDENIEVVNEVVVQTEDPEESENATIIDDNVSLNDNNELNASEVVTHANPRIVEKRVGLDLDQPIASNSASGNQDKTQKAVENAMIENNFDSRKSNGLNDKVISDDKLRTEKEQLDMDLDQSSAPKGNANKQDQQQVANRLTTNISVSDDLEEDQAVEQDEELDEELDVEQDEELDVEQDIEQDEELDVEQDDEQDEEQEEGETNQKRRSSRIRYKELVIREYNLRQNPRIQPINYRDQIYITNNETDEEEYVPPTAAPKSLVSAAAVAEPNDSSSDDPDRMISKIKFFVCDYNGCGKVLRSRQGFVIHRKKHLNDCKEDDQQLFFRCEYNYCHKIFATKEAVDRHQQKYHQHDMVIFKCHFKKCGKEFDNRVGLTEHFAVHTQVKQLEVQVKKVKQNTSIVRGKQSNDKKLPFRCHFCPSSFKDLRAIKEHLNRHCEQFRCKLDGCSYRADGKNSLKKHQLQKHNKH